MLFDILSLSVCHFKKSLYMICKHEAHTRIYCGSSAICMIAKLQNIHADINDTKQRMCKRKKRKINVRKEL